MAKLLLMEDDEVQADMLSVGLIDAGHSVKVSYNGNEAWLHLCAQPFDLLITDMLVPVTRSAEGGGGFLLVNRIRRTRWEELHPDNREIPIITISGAGQKMLGQDLLESAISSGADSALRKPIRFEDLLSEIDRLLS